MCCSAREGEGIKDLTWKKEAKWIVLSPIPLLLVEFIRSHSAATEAQLLKQHSLALFLCPLARLLKTDGFVPTKRKTTGNFGPEMSSQQNIFKRLERRFPE